MNSKILYLFKNSKFKSFTCFVTRRYGDTNQLKSSSKTDTVCAPAEDMVCWSAGWDTAEAQDLHISAAAGLRVFPEFLNEHEEKAMMAELEPRLRTLRYLHDHWDDAIEGYRETERGQWSAESAAVLERMRLAAFPPETRTLPQAHVLDLAPSGQVKPHVDATRYCGDVIAGLSLLSSAVMRLRPVAPHLTHLTIDALLARRSLYVLSGGARYDMTHAVLGTKESIWQGSPLKRTRRVAIILRAPPDPNQKNL